MKIFYSLKSIKTLFILIVVLSFTKSAYYETINLYKDFNKSYRYNENKFFVTYDEDYSTNYIKLEVELLNNYNGIAISYYQKDYNFKERKQLSYNFSNSTFMWLNKNQFKNNFYFSINCKKTYYCDYNLHIYKKKYAELNIGDIYTYYVTEENKDMTFLININYTKYNNSISDISNSKISIWARGSNNNINSKLEPNSYTNLMNDKYQAYLLYKNEIDINEHYYLKIEGNIGDLINVGSLLFDENNTCPIIFKNLGTEITGFFKENIFEKNCFKFIGSNDNSFNQFIYDFEIKNYIENYEFNYFNYYTLVCLNFNKTYKYDEYLYSLQYVRNVRRDRLNYLVSPLIIGKNYKISLNIGETIGLIPTNPDIDFNFLTYHANGILGECNYSVYECSSYPFCDSFILKQKNFKYNDGSYSISYTKNEYNNTPISLNQKVLLIKSMNFNNIIIVNFYSDKNKIFISPQITFYNYLRKNNEDNLLINLPYNEGEVPDSPYAYLSFEILSGDASINFGAPKSSYLEAIQNNTKKSFKFRLIQKNENLLKIKANKNSVYSIIYILEETNKKRLTGDYIFPIGNNYLFEVKNNNGDYYHYLNSRFNYYGYIYFEFHPINCEIEVQNNNNYRWKVLNKYKGFSYDIEDVNTQYSFFIRRVGLDKRKSCLVYASSFMYSSYILNPIFLIISNNIPKYFLFHDNYEVNFLYYHSEVGNDLIVDFKMNHSSIYNYYNYYPYRSQIKASYFLACYINNYAYNLNCSYYNYNYYNINIYNNDSFKINSNQIKKYCTDENQFCMIRFIIVKSSYNKNKNTAIELNIRTIENNLSKSTNSKFLKDNLKLIIIISGSALIFIIIIIIIIIVCICKKKNNKDLLALEVNKVSFEEERANRNKAYEDGLLY